MLPISGDPCGSKVAAYMSVTSAATSGRSASDPGSHRLPKWVYLDLLNATCVGSGQSSGAVRQSSGACSPPRWSIWYQPSPAVPHPYHQRPVSGSAVWAQRSITWSPSSAVTIRSSAPIRAPNCMISAL
jgi:hypothetical protein